MYSNLIRNSSFISLNQFRLFSLKLSVFANNTATRINTNVKESNFLKVPPLVRNYGRKKDKDDVVSIKKAEKTNKIGFGARSSGDSEEQDKQLDLKKNKNISKKRVQGRGIEGKYVYTLEGVSKYIENEPVLEDINLKFLQGAKIGVLGVNGSGKSTLMKIIAGEEEFEGTAKPLGNVVIGYLPQEPQLDMNKTVIENVLDGVPEKVKVLKRYNELKEIVDDEDHPITQEEIEEYEGLSEIVDQEKLYDLQRRIEVSMMALRCPPNNSSVKNISGGELRRIALCRLLVSAPDILLLDEPTNHLDAESIAWLERFLLEYKGCIIAITHDRYFLDNVAGWILEIDRGQCIPFDGNYSEWLISKQARLDLEKKKEASRARQIKEELEWLRSNLKGGQTKNKARVSRYNEMIERKEFRNYETGQIIIPSGPRLGDIVIKATDIKKTIGDKILFDNLSFEILPGAIVGIIGPNGAGKTTLFRVITGEIEPDSGTVRIGKTVKMKHISQDRCELNDSETVLQAISEDQQTITIDDREVHVRHYMSSFNLKGSIQNRLIGSLSGGERNRVLLAKVLKNGCNLLLLDEPSNDLDIDTLRSLEEAISEFPGSAIVISHDRWFLDRICTHILAFEGQSSVYFHNGNYSSYEYGKKLRLGKKLAKFSYKRLALA